MNKRISLISIIILLLALYIHIVPFHVVVPLKKEFADFPYNWKDWRGSAYFFDSAVLDRLRVSEYMLREYRKGSDRVVLYVGYYGSQKAGSQIHSPKHCLPGSGWFKISEKNRNLYVDGIGKINYIEAVYKKGDERKIFAYWYRMKNAYITNEYVLKLYMILNSLRYRRNDAAFVRISKDITDNEENSVHSVEQFMKDTLPLLKDFISD